MDECGQGSVQMQVVGPRMNASAWLTNNKLNTYELYSTLNGVKTNLSAGTYYIRFKKQSNNCNYFVNVRWKYA